MRLRVITDNLKGAAMRVVDIVVGRPGSLIGAVGIAFGLAGTAYAAQAEGSGSTITVCVQHGAARLRAAGAPTTGAIERHARERRKYQKRSRPASYEDPGARARYLSTPSRVEPPRHLGSRACRRQDR